MGRLDLVRDDFPGPGTQSHVGSAIGPYGMVLCGALLGDPWEWDDAWRCVAGC